MYISGESDNDILCSSIYCPKMQSAWLICQTLEIDQLASNILLAKLSVDQFAWKYWPAETKLLNDRQKMQFIPNEIEYKNHNIAK